MIAHMGGITELHCAASGGSRLFPAAAQPAGNRREPPKVVRSPEQLQNSPCASQAGSRAIGVPLQGKSNLQG